MYSRLCSWLAGVFALSLVGCVTLPSGPSVMALPRDGVSFEQFEADDDLCRQWAARRVGIAPQQVAERQLVTGAAIGTAVGAAAGALIGAATGDAGEGAAIGAGSGLLLGGAAGVARGDAEGYAAQSRYDDAYVQCMYAKGHQVPLPAGAARAVASAPRPAPPPYSRPLRPPPPPRGSPPPPPPGYY
jgi:hypothetical protein